MGPTCQSKLHLIFFAFLYRSLWLQLLVRALRGSGAHSSHPVAPSNRRHFACPRPVGQAPLRARPSVWALSGVAGHRSLAATVLVYCPAHQGTWNTMMLPHSTQQSILAGLHRQPSSEELRMVVPWPCGASWCLPSLPTGMPPCSAPAHPPRTAPPPLTAPAATKRGRGHLRRSHRGLPAALARRGRRPRTARSQGPPGTCLMARWRTQEGRR